LLTIKGECHEGEGEVVGVESTKEIGRLFVFLFPILFGLSIDGGGGGERGE
jgi:hypothetical protein